MQGRVTDIPVRIPTHRLETSTTALRASLGKDGYEVLRWYDMFPVIKEWVVIDTGFHYVLSGVVLFIVLVGVLTTVLLAMLERTREFGVLIALGTQRQEIASMVAAETLLVGLLGIGLGTLSGRLPSGWLRLRGSICRRFSATRPGSMSIRSFAPP